MYNEFLTVHEMLHVKMNYKEALKNHSVFSTERIKTKYWLYFNLFLASLA